MSGGAVDLLMVVQLKNDRIADLAAKLADADDAYECAHKDAVAWYEMAEKYQWQRDEAVAEWASASCGYYYNKTQTIAEGVASLDRRWEERAT